VEWKLLGAAREISGIVELPRSGAVSSSRAFNKNFPSYVNAFRLEEVRLRLTDSRNDHLPILTLGLAAGFGSIVVFNRVFKERYLMTPTEYRAQRH